MYFLSIEDHFSSAHQLREYKGKCENLHGHNWRIKLTVCGEELDSLGMLIDFGILKSILKEILSLLDHKFINQIPPFDKINPSAENIAFFLYQKIDEYFTQKYPKIKVYQIDVWESEKACASFRQLGE